MPHPKIFKLKQFDNSRLRAISFYNMVLFYKNELEQLSNFVSTKNIFKEAEQNSLMKLGLFFSYIVKVDKKYKGTISHPTCLTRMIMAGMIKIDRRKLLDELIELGDNDA